MVKDKKIEGEPKVSIVFLNWNAKKHVLELINSLRKMNYKNFDIIISNNNPRDRIEDSLNKKDKTFITVINNSKNLGEAEGLNVGIREGLKRKSKYILIMDNDMYVDKDFLAFLVKEIEADKNVAAAGPKIYYSKPENRIWSAGCDYHFRGFRSRFQDQIDKGQADKKKYVSAIDTVMLIRTDVLREEGLLRGEFFTMHEMTGWCLKVTKKNYKILYVPESKIWHKVSATLNTKKNKKEIVTYYGIRNWILCNRHHEKFYYFFGILLLEFLVLFPFRSFKYLRNRELFLIRTNIFAIWHAIIKKTPLKLYPY